MCLQETSHENLLENLLRAFQGTMVTGRTPAGQNSKAVCVAISIVMDK